MQSMMGQMNGGVSIPAQMQHQQYGMMMPGQAGRWPRRMTATRTEMMQTTVTERRCRKRNQRGGASEFVKKLFRMLDDTSYAHIVSWGPLGDSFVVREMNDFTKHVLPRHFDIRICQLRTAIGTSTTSTRSGSRRQKANPSPSG